jgi:hypothetical protein
MSVPHPLESVFSIEPGSTPVQTAAAQVSAEMVDPATGDIIERKTEGVTDPEIAKEERIEDLKIDNQIDVIHSAAMGAFEAQLRLSQEVDPKFAARNAEVAAAYLKIALDSVGTRVDAKYKRSKVRLAQNEGPRSVQNNLIVADRNDLLKNLFEGGNKPTIDQEPQK